MESTEGLLIFDAAKSNIIATLSPECAPRTLSIEIHVTRGQTQRKHIATGAMLLRMGFPTRLLLILFAADFREAFGNVLLVVYEETEQDMLSLFEDNLGRDSMNSKCKFILLKTSKVFRTNLMNIKLVSNHMRHKMSQLYENIGLPGHTCIELLFPRRSLA